MNDPVFITGFLGSVILVFGSALPDPAKNIKPSRTLKHWFFGLGNLSMFTYAFLAFLLKENPVFFVFLESLCTSSSVLILLNVKESFSSRFILFAGGILLLCSLFLFEDYTTVFFILGLIGIAIGFATKNDIKRNTSFIVGSLLITAFSFLKEDAIFFWLNLLFAAFSGFYLLKAMRKR